MYQIMRIALACLAAYLSAPYLVYGLHWIFGDVFIHGTPYWAEHAHIAVYWVCALLAFFLWLGMLAELPRIGLSALATYLTVGPIADQVFWILNVPEPHSAKPLLFGMCTVFVFSIWTRLFERVPKLYWLR